MENTECGSLISWTIHKLMDEAYLECLTDLQKLFWHACVHVFYLKKNVLTILHSSMQPFSILNNIGYKYCHCFEAKK